MECRMDVVYTPMPPEQEPSYRLAIEVVYEMILADERGKPFDLWKMLLERASGAKDTAVSGPTCQPDHRQGHSPSFPAEGRFESALPD